MMNNIDFTDYDRITDTLMYLSSDITLNFTVSLANKDKIGNRKFYHYEAEYTSKFNDANIARSIKRNMNFYFVIDNKNDFGNGIILRPRDVELLKMAFDMQILPWFFGPKRIFRTEENRLIIGKYKPVIYSQSESKYLSFIPIVYTYEDNTFKEGIRIEIGNANVDLEIDRFLEFVNIIRNTDMYTAAIGLTTYAKCPPYGINNFPMQTGLGSYQKSTDIDYKPTVRNGFFDSIQKKGDNNE